ncbi:MAG: outer membrane protein assembly factor BamD [Pseudomonadota bacterium]
MGLNLKPSVALAIKAPAALVIAAAVAACSGARIEEVGFNDTPADQLYNEGLVLMNEGDYRTASLKFEEVDRLHPHTEFGRKSQMMLAFASYSRGKYPEAINAGRRFVTLYPNHKDAPYAQYIISNSYYKQIPDVTRDQDQTKKALKEFETLVEKYPESEYADDARSKIRASRDQLAGKEMEVGRYYLERHDNLAAVNRFRHVVENYQQTRHVEEALFRLTESYYALGLTQEAQTAAAVLGHNFPDSKWYRDAHSLLQKGGFSPSESESSWISRAMSRINVL